ncbi:hypothetical protein LZC95_34550 [Pendulispora brunnea]|uniref:Lipoprotein n=1 Tax=Pendulispora brunnea TaxID=2905690 RepID=A0ABZ2K2Z9_9BACT
MKLMRRWAWMMACVAATASTAACGGDDSSEKGSVREALARSDGLKVGHVALYNQKTELRSVHGGSSNFYGGWRPPPNPRCETTTEGSCTVSRCQRLTSADYGPSFELIEASAGLVEIRRSNSPEVLTLGPGRSGLEAAGSLWSGGEQFTIKAAGDSDGVPGFETSLKAPSMVKVTAPGQPTAGGWIIPRSRDFELQWTYEGEPSGVVTIGMGDGRFNLDSVECKVPVQNGGVKIPASALAVLSAGTGYWSLHLLEEKTIEVEGGWKVTASLFTEGAGPGAGGLASVPVTFE